MRCATNIKGKVISEMQLNIEMLKCIFDIGMKAYQKKRISGIKRNRFKGNENIIKLKHLQNSFHRVSQFIVFIPSQF